MGKTLKTAKLKDVQFLTVKFIIFTTFLFLAFFNLKMSCKADLVDITSTFNVYTSGSCSIVHGEGNYNGEPISDVCKVCPTNGVSGTIDKSFFHEYNFYNIVFEEGVYLPSDSSYLFADSEFFLLDVSNLNTSNVTSMAGMFKNSSIGYKGLIGFENWDFSKPMRPL